MSTKHKHADLIHAWADGRTTQIKDVDGKWRDIPSDKHCWYEENEYRIKPEPVTLYVNEFIHGDGGLYYKVANPQTDTLDAVNYIRTIKLQEVEDEA